MKHFPFPSIEGFHNVVKAIDAYPHICPTLVTYRGKIKLHGTNASVRISLSGEIGAQSRTNIVTPDADNVGFARWVDTQKDYWASLKNNSEVTIYGEWCGRGIMKGAAICQIPKKIFAVFAIMLGGQVDFTQPDAVNTTVIIEPDEIAKFLRELIEDVYVLPWQGSSFVVDFSNRESLQPIVDSLNANIAELEPCDPWVKSVFGVEGISEGVVYYPVNASPLTRKMFSDLSFKAKGDKHKVVKTKTAVQVDPEVAASVNEFVSMFVTEARMEQGLVAIGGKADLSKTGEFLKWACSDINKESADELEASELEWEQVAKNVSVAVRNWFLAKAKQLP